MMLVGEQCAKCLKNNCVKFFNMAQYRYAATAAKVKIKSYTEEQSKVFYTKRKLLYKNQDELVQHLLDNVLYNDEHILAVNKPAGLPLKALQYHDEMTKLPPGFTVPVTQDLSVFGIIKELASQVNAENLHCAFSLQRESSGVLLFTKTVEAAVVMKKHYLTNKIHKIHSLKYIGVLTSIPEPLEDTSTILITRQNINGWPVSCLAEKVGKRRKDVCRCALHYEVRDISRSLNVALVNIYPNTSKWDSIPMYFLHKLAPLLGDHMYGHQLKTLMGKPFVEKQRNIESDMQVLPRPLCAALDMHWSDCSFLPLHLHCSSLTVPSMERGKKKQNTITAPLPEYFLRTLNKLGLKYDVH